MTPHAVVSGRCVIATRFAELPNSQWTLFGIWRPGSAAEWSELRRLLDGKNALERIELLPCARLRTVLKAMVEFGHGTEVRVTFVDNLQ